MVSNTCNVSMEAYSWHLDVYHVVVGSCDTGHCSQAGGAQLDVVFLLPL